MTYYTKAFTQLIEAGVPKWFIRLYALDDLAYFSRIHFYYAPYDVNAEDGWYTTNAVGITSKTKGGSTSYFGHLDSKGFPTWDEYVLLFDGDEYDEYCEFVHSFELRREEWFDRRRAESSVQYQ